MTAQSQTWCTTHSGNAGRRPIPPACTAFMPRPYTIHLLPGGELRFNADGEVQRMLSSRPGMVRGGLKCQVSMLLGNVHEHDLDACR